jgi:hypothetical protein
MKSYGRFTHFISYQGEVIRAVTVFKHCDGSPIISRNSTYTAVTINLFIPLKRSIGSAKGGYSFA